MKKIISKVVTMLFVCVLLFSHAGTIEASEADVNVSVKNSAGKVVITYPVTKSAASKGIQKALDYVNANATEKNPLTVVLPKGTYTIGDSLNIYSNTTLDLSKGVTLERSSGAAIMRFGRSSEESKGYSGYENITIIGAKDNYAVLDGDGRSSSILRFAHSNGIKIQYIEFTNVKEAHHLEFAGCKDVVIDSCKFNGFSPKGKENGTNYEAVQMDILLKKHFPNYGLYDGTVSSDIKITNNVFEDVNRGVGAHSAQIGVYMKNIEISSNTFKNVNGYAIVTTNFLDSKITDNKMINCGSGIFFRHISPDYVNYYAGNNKGIVTDMNCEISNNEISLKETTFDNTPYGIKVYGKLVKSETKGKAATIPAADFRAGNVTIKDNSITSATYANAIWLQGAINNTLSNNTVSFKIASGAKEDECDGIKLENSCNNLLSKNTITELAKKPILRHGLNIKDESDGNTVQDMTIKDTAENGIYIYNSDACTLKKNQIVNAGKHGIYIDKNAGNKKKTTLAESNKITNPAKRGICVNDNSYAVVKSNTISNSGEEGVYIGKSAFANVISNTISGSGADGIYANGSASSSAIEKNTISKAGDSGIYINTKAKADKIYKNKITSSKSHGIYVSGASVAKTILENSISKSGAHGIYIKDNSTVTSLIKNTFTDSTECGIRVIGGKVSKVSGNTVKKSSKKVSATNGIFISGVKTKISEISSNKVSDIKENGIYLSEGTVVDTIGKNTLTNIGVNGLYIKDNCKATKVSNNSITTTKNHGIYVNDKAVVSTIASNTINKASKVGIAIYSTSTKTTVKSNTIKNCSKIGLDICTSAKVTASENKISACKESENRIQKNGKNKKIDTSSFKIKSAKKSGKTVVLKWAKVKNVDSYMVYRSTSKGGKYEKIGTTKNLSYTDKKVKKGKTYFYKVVPYTKYAKSEIQFASTEIVSVKYK